LAGDPRAAAAKSGTKAPRIREETDNPKRAKLRRDGDDVET
jgi:hypothetical protein